MWYPESKPQIARALRQKSEFTEEFMDHVLRSIENLGRHFPLVLLDLGGKRSAENAAILNLSTHCIILSSDPTETNLWKEFAEAADVVVIADFESKQVKLPDGSLDSSVRSEILLETIPVKGILFNLTRAGDAHFYRESVSEFATWLVQKFVRSNVK